jgi:hypothetical protein
MIMIETFVCVNACGDGTKQDEIRRSCVAVENIQKLEGVNLIPLFFFI